MGSRKPEALMFGKLHFVVDPSIINHKGHQVLHKGHKGFVQFNGRVLLCGPPLGTMCVLRALGDSELNDHHLCKVSILFVADLFIF